MTLGIAITVIMSSCSKDDNPANAPFDTTGRILNLSDITDTNVPRNIDGKSEIVVSDGQTLTGTLRRDVIVLIADGATVTLSNVNIGGAGIQNGSHAGITCLGDAHIVLSENTVNTVRGFDTGYPGIQIKAGSKLSIEGTGVLNPEESAFNTVIGINWNYASDNTPIVGSTVGSPLYVVDGVVLNDTFTLPFDDIESIGVLKDAASVAIYGARGANGVILINTTKNHTLPQ